jgi:hypothetical protein
LNNGGFEIFVADDCRVMSVSGAVLHPADVTFANVSRVAATGGTSNGTGQAYQGLFF